MLRAASLKLPSTSGPGDDQRVGQAELGETGAFRAAVFGVVQRRRRPARSARRPWPWTTARGAAPARGPSWAGSNSWLRTTGPKARGAADELGRAARAVTGAAGALLLVHLLAGARDSRCGSAPCGCRRGAWRAASSRSAQDVGADLVDAEDVVGRARSEPPLPPSRVMTSIFIAASPPFGGLRRLRRRSSAASAGRLGGGFGAVSRASRRLDRARLRRIGRQRRCFTASRILT